MAARADAAPATNECSAAEEIRLDRGRRCAEHTGGTNVASLSQGWTGKTQTSNDIYESVIDVRFQNADVDLGSGSDKGPEKESSGALSFSIPPLGRSEAGGGLNALSHCAEEKAGASGKREWGGCRFYLRAGRKGGVRRSQRLSLLLVTTVSVDGSPGVMRFMSRIKSRMVSCGRDSTILVSILRSSASSGVLPHRCGAVSKIMSRGIKPMISQR